MNVRNVTYAHMFIIHAKKERSEALSNHITVHVMALQKGAPCLTFPGYPPVMSEVVSCCHGGFISNLRLLNYSPVHAKLNTITILCQEACQRG